MMKVLQDPGSRGESFPPFAPNGQLPTPTLSPAPSDTETTGNEHAESGISARLTNNDGRLSGSQEEERNQSKVAKTMNGSSESRGMEQKGSDRQRSRKSSATNPVSPLNEENEKDHVLKLSPAKIHELTSSPTSLPLRAVSPAEHLPPLAEAPLIFEKGKQVLSPAEEGHIDRGLEPVERTRPHGGSRRQSSTKPRGSLNGIENTPKSGSTTSAVKPRRPSFATRTVSTPPVMGRKHSSARTSSTTIEGPQPLRPHHRPLPLDLDGGKPSGTSGGLKPPSSVPDPVASPMPPTIPLPPLSIPTYLQLELSSEKPSPLYIHRSATNDFPYESSRIKFERLLNFLILPFELEQSLWFGALACLDAWLYTFTILPLRFFKAIWILAQSWSTNLVREARDISKFIYEGLGRVWQRRHRADSVSTETVAGTEESSARLSPLTPLSPTSMPTVQENSGTTHIRIEATGRKNPRSSVFRHRRTKSVPSALLPDHKADILKGLLVLATCILLMRFDSSKTYHNIRGQSAIKLYVIYNVLEVCDRLFSALGQDILECLLSRETLERNPDGRSKVIRPFSMFLLALVYNAIHATALFYQVITLNVAVNSYSNALLTLLMSNQFVEIKGTVFKKFEKENLFQLTCADMVERFQLWLMLMIIAFRNIVEVGGLSIKLGDVSGAAAGGLGSNNTNAPFRSTSIIPKSFTIFPKWTGQVMGPFLLVLGSEMLVDWLKHAYITKFNNTKPALYGRFLDVLAKDYYSHAFADQNLTKRLGLPVIPLACLFIRATIQTYHMFLATHMPLPMPSTATSLSVESSATSSPATTAALAHIDHIFRRALGRSTFGAGVAFDSAPGFSWWSLDDVIAFATMAVVFLVAYFVLLAIKLVLGMCLLSFARRRYKGMKERERVVHMTEGKRVGGWGVVEVEDDKKRWIYADDPDGLRALREREIKAKEKEEKGAGVGLGGVKRYDMVAKRIW